jgi:hypothetical protein
MTYTLLQLGIGDQAVAIKKKLLRPWEIFENVTDVTTGDNFYSKGDKNKKFDQRWKSIAQLPWYVPK